MRSGVEGDYEFAAVAVACASQAGVIVRSFEGVDPFFEGGDFGLRQVAEEERGGGEEGESGFEFGEDGCGAHVGCGGGGGGEGGFGDSASVEDLRSSKHEHNNESKRDGRDK